MINVIGGCPQYTCAHSPRARCAKRAVQQDVIEVLKKIHVPVICWPGACSVSACHWKYGAGWFKSAIGRLDTGMRRVMGAFRSESCSGD